MTKLNFDNQANQYTVTGSDNYEIRFFGGDDRLTVDGGTFTTGLMGDGNDLAILRSGDGAIYGQGGNDRFNIYGDGFEAHGGAGNDLFDVRGGNDLLLRGDVGSDRFDFMLGATGVTAFGGDDNDAFYGYGRTVGGTLYGQDGNDRFIGFGDHAGQSVTIYGGTGNDLYRADATSPSTFIEHAGEGTDAVQVARGASYTLPENIEVISVQGFSGSTTADSTLTGNELNNRITGHNNNETIYGLDGNDLLGGKGGDDILDGGKGADSLYGGTGTDHLYGGEGNDHVDGGAGDDIMAGGAGDDSYWVDSLGDQIIEDSAAGTDTVRTSVSGYVLADNVEIGIVSGGAGLTLTGNGLDNQLTGNAGDDTIYGLDGNDILKGAGGDDHLYGGNGDDIINGGTGADYMNGGAGNDTYYVDNPGDVVDEGPLGILGGMDTVISSVADYTLGSDIEVGRISGTAGGTLTGNLLNNDIGGSAGNDVLNGLAGDDVIHGGGGNDIINGGLGADVLTGGDGSDVFQFSSALDSNLLTSDTITDFQAGEDSIDLSGMDANDLLGGDQAFNVVSALTGVAGQLLLTDDGSGNALIQADVNGDGLVDFMLNLHATSIADVNVIL